MSRVCAAPPLSASTAVDAGASAMPVPEMAAVAAAAAAMMLALMEGLSRLPNAQMSNGKRTKTQGMVGMVRVWQAICAWSVMRRSMWYQRRVRMLA